MIEVTYLPPDDKCIDIDYLRREDISSTILLDQVFEEESNRIPDIHSIEIETINACNNDCSFCPASRTNDTRIHQLMSEDLFKKIISDLERMQYSGMLSLFSNNEPLLDKRIIKFIAYARKHLPNAKHALYTNGILLDAEKFELLCENLDKLIIDNYSDELELNDNIKSILDTFDKRNIQCRVKVFVRKKNQIRDTRGGQSPNREKVSGFYSACMLPISQMIIRPDGKVSLCCQDAMGLVTLGDVSRESITEVWRGKAYLRLRKDLYMGLRSELPNCCNCDIFGVVNYRPRKWDHLIKEGFIKWVYSSNCKHLYISGSNDFQRKITRLVDTTNIVVRSLNSDKCYLDDGELLCVEENDSTIIAPFEKNGQEVGEKILICGVLMTVED